MEETLATQSATQRRHHIRRNRGLSLRLGSSSPGSRIIRLRFPERNDPGLIHLMHRAGDLRRVRFSGKLAEKVREKSQGAEKGKDGDGDEKHSGARPPGERRRVCYKTRFSRNGCTCLGHETIYAEWQNRMKFRHGMWV